MIIQQVPGTWVLERRYIKLVLLLTCQEAALQKPNG